MGDHVSYAMNMENYFFKKVLDESFPGYTQYLNEQYDQLENIQRPAFIFCDPEDMLVNEEMTRLVLKSTKTFTLYALYEPGDVYQGEEIIRRFSGILLGQKKHQVPGTEKFITIEGISSEVNKASCVITFTINTGRTIQREVPDDGSHKIYRVILNEKEVLSYAGE